MGLTFAIIFGGIVFYALERLSIELTSVLIIAALLVLFQIGAPGTPGLDARGLLAGFADPALITIMALLVIGQGIFQTGALESVSQGLSGYLEQAPRRTLLFVFACAFVISMFMNNTPVVVMFIPIVVAMAQQLRASASRYLMPLSFICILAGMTTLIGSSTNILVAGVLEQMSDQEIAFFDPAWPGAFLALIGAIYIIVAAPFLLPRRGSAQDERVSGQQYIAEIKITDKHPLNGKAPVAGLFSDLSMLTVRVIRRGPRKLLPPYETPLQSGDVLTVSTTRDALAKLLSSHPEYLQGMLAISGFEAGSGPARMAISEAMIAPASRMVGRSIEQAGFRRSTGCLVLGIKRRSHMIREGMMNIRLQPGDVLLLFGYVPQIEAMRENHDLLLLDWATQDLPDIRRAMRARMIFAGVIIFAAFGILPIVHAAFCGAAAMVAAGCLNVRQAVRAFDMKIFMLIGAAFSMGSALQHTGGAAMIADMVTKGLAGYGPQVLIGGLFLLVAVMTNLLSNSATAILFAPIAINMAASAGIDPKIMVLTVLFAANCSFATPIAYQTNLLVMGPGNYRFADFCRFGIPLTLLLWVSYTVMLPFVFSL